MKKGVDSMHKRLHKALWLCQSLNELLRMELAVSDKLHRDLHIRTLLDFLSTLHAPLVLHWPNVKELRPQRDPSLYVASLKCVEGHQLL